MRFSGRHYDIPECEVGPKPVRPDGPRMLMGAATPAGLARAARLGLGLTLVMFTWEMLEATIEQFHGLAKDAGHDPASLPIVVQVNGAVSESPADERAPLTGSVEQVADDVARLASLHVDHVLWATAPDPDEQLRNIARLRSRVS